MLSQLISRDDLLSADAPAGVRSTRDGIGWNSASHSLAIEWQTGEDAGWAWYLHSANDYDSGPLDSLTELDGLFKQMKTTA